MKASPVPTAQVIRARAAAEFSHGHSQVQTCAVPGLKTDIG